MRGKSLFFGCGFLALLAGASVTFGIMFVDEGGQWPGNWPEGLEPLRSSARTGYFRAGAHATYYYIEFDRREQFEQAWPALLRVKSNGAPLTLMSVDLPKTDPDDRRVVYSRPMAVIQCPAQGHYVKLADGRYTHVGPWTEAIEGQLVDGILPEFVGKDGEERWRVITEPRDPNSIHQYGVFQRARVELHLYVDGEIIDLNRIRLPEDTPIRDRRRLE